MIVCSVANADDLRGTANPDTGHVQGARGAQDITLLPRNDAGDFQNFQWAVDNVAPGGTINLGAGTFFLGDGEASPKRTVIIRQGLRITGVKEGGEWRSVVRGGGEVMRFGIGSNQLESGPFRVINEDDPNPVVFEHVWIRDWTCEAVYLEACHGFEFRDCRLSHPVNSGIEGAMRYVHALWSSGARTRGDFIVENNLIEMGNYSDGLPDDEQLLGAFYSNHDNIRVVNNTIVGLDEAVEIIGNRDDLTAMGEGPPSTGPGEVVVTDNRIKVTQNLGNRWAGTFAILVAANKGADVVRIENNDMDVTGKGWAFGISGKNLRITGNTVRMGEFDGRTPAGAFYIGFGMLGPYNMEASLVDSVIENNTFSGKVGTNGMLFNTGSAQMPNESQGNRIYLGDSFATLGARTTLTIAKGLHDNVFTGDLGTVVNNAPDGANTLENR